MTDDTLVTSCLEPALSHPDGHTPRADQALIRVCPVRATPLV